jgi:hypothetical protein
VRRLDEVRPELRALYVALLAMRKAAPAVVKPGAAKEDRRDRRVDRPAAA